jgi:hypothetical protein
MKFDATKVFLFLSLLLNALGGSGLVSPVIAPAAPQCEPCRCGSTSVGGAGGDAGAQQ